MMYSQGLLVSAGQTSPRRSALMVSGSLEDTEVAGTTLFQAA